MKLSTRARYALRAMVAIAKETRGTNGTMSLADVAKKTSISRRYLEQLVISLKNASLVTGVMGKGGGYHLTRDTQDITIAEIIEAAIGPINIVDCVLMPDVCLQADVCECRSLYENINQRIVGALQGISLAELAAGRGNDAPVNFEENAEFMGCPSRRPIDEESS